MGLFRKRPATPPPTVAESLQGLIQTAGQPSLFAHSEFVKQVTCPACGAPKRLPSKTAYLYCDHCGALVDYDFRLANSGTNAGLTNTAFHQLIAPVQGDLDRARATGDAGRYRELLLVVVSSPGQGGRPTGPRWPAAGVAPGADPRTPAGLRPPVTGRWPSKRPSRRGTPAGPS